MRNGTVSVWGMTVPGNELDPEKSVSQSDPEKSVSQSDPEKSVSQSPRGRLELVGTLCAHAGLVTQLKWATCDSCQSAGKPPPLQNLNPKP